MFCLHFRNHRTLIGYSNLSNNRTVSNKSIQGYNFGLLLHEIARFWPFLTHSCLKINNRTCTIIREARVSACQDHSVIKWKIYSRQRNISSNQILIEITQCHYLVVTFLQNRTTDFDETLHVAWVWLPEGFGNSRRSGYSPVQKKSGRRPL